MKLLFTYLITLIILIIVNYYFFKKLSTVLKFSRFTLFNQWNQILPKIILVFLNIYPISGVIFQLYKVLTVQPDLRFPKNFWTDTFIIYPFWIIGLFLLQMLLYFLLSDLIRFSFWKKYRRNRPAFLTYQSRILLPLSVFFFIYVPARIVYDDSMIDITPIEIVKDGLPTDLQRLRIVLISDIQADYYTQEKRINDYIEKVNAQKPDLIFIAGDMITGDSNYIDIAGKLSGNLNAKYGVFACVGDHDQWAYRPDITRSINEVKEAFRKNNIPILDNENHTIPIGNSNVSITAVKYTYSSKIAPNELDTLVKKTAPSDFKVFLSHQPNQDLIHTASKNNYDLFLAGHTHGGQVNFILPFKLFSFSSLETPFTSGKFSVNKMIIAVSKGLGVSVAPVRYNATPDFALITLHSNNESIFFTEKK